MPESKCFWAKLLNVLLAAVLAVGLMPSLSFAAEPADAGEGGAGGQAAQASQPDDPGSEQAAAADGQPAGSQGGSAAAEGGMGAASVGESDSSAVAAADGSTESGEAALGVRSIEPSAIDDDGYCVIGTGTSSNYNSTLLGNLNYKNSVSETVYLASEIGSAGTITELAVQVSAATATVSTAKLNIYLAHTQSTGWSGTSAQSAINPDAKTLVYSGAPTLGTVASGWDTYELTTPFDYNGTDNLLVIVERSAASYTSNIRHCYTSTSSGCTTWSVNDDDNASYADFDYAMSLTASPSSSRPNIRFAIETCSHDNKQFVATHAATCEDEGYDEYYCPDCEKTLKENVTPALGHDWVLDRTEGAIEYYVCSRDASHTKTVNTKIDAWDGTSAEIWDEGDGTQASPYIIDTSAKLAYLAQQVNASSSTHYADTYFKVTKDLDLSAGTWTPVGAASSFSAYSSPTYYFAGHFDGGGHEITLGHSAQAGYLGLFGALYGSSSSSATVQNVVVKGSLANTGTSTSAIGGIAAYTNYAGISSCRNEAALSAAGGSYMGGIVGYAGGTTVVSNCSNKGSITDNSTTTSSIGFGGIAGFIASSASCAVENCYNQGDVSAYYYQAGGIVGYWYGYSSSAKSLSNCYNAGTVTVRNATYSTRGGGLVGYLYGSSSYQSAQTISNSYTRSDASAGGAIGYPASPYCTFAGGLASAADCLKSATDMAASDFVALLNAGTSEAFAAGDTYPRLAWELPAGTPEITAQEVQDAAYVLNAQAQALSVTVTADEETYGTLTYQWYRDDAALEGDAAKTATYTPATGELGSHTYYCVVANTAGAATSAKAVVTVWSGTPAAAPSVTGPSSIASIDQLATEGNTLSVEAALTGEGETLGEGGTCALSYQWQVYNETTSAWDDIDGATEASYAAPTASIGTLRYRCVVTNTREVSSNTAQATSAEATVTVVGKTIGTAAELIAFANEVNGVDAEGNAVAANSYAGLTVTLTADITVTLDAPIGKDSGHPFAGEFDGGGHVVTLALGSAEAPYAGTYAGLFGNVAGSADQRASVHDVTARGTVFSAYAAATSTVYSYAAGIAACAANADIYNVGNEVAVSSQVTGYPQYSYTAGIVAYLGSGSSLARAYSTGSIAATTNAGGIVGRAVSSSVADCYARGTVAGGGSYSGGVAAYLQGSGSSYTGCYTACTVQGSSTNQGAVFGYTITGTSVSDVYYDSDAAGSLKAIGYNLSGAAATAKTASELQGLAATLNGERADGDAPWAADEYVVNAGYPVLAWQVSSGFEDAPRITAQSASRKVLQGSSADPLSVTAVAPEGAESGLSYQWQALVAGEGGPSWQDIDGAVSGECPCPTDTIGTFTYRCVVTCGDSSVTSVPVEVLVYPAAATPTVSVTPSDDQAISQIIGTATLTATAATSDADAVLSYQWYASANADLSEAAAVDGATDAAFQVPVDTQGTTYYYCVVTSTLVAQDNTATAQSGAVKVTVDAVTVSTPDELLALSQAVRAGSSFAGATVTLTSDIDLSSDADTATWTPIGTSSRAFSGTFEGGGHTISGLNVGTVVTGGSDYVGLFGYVSGATIRNLVVQGSVVGSWSVGVVAGYAYGATTIANVGVAAGSSVQAYQNAAGIVGAAASPGTVISQCYNKGSVEANRYLGGICGNISVSGVEISSCYNTGSVTCTNSAAEDSYETTCAGGISGRGGTIANCVNAGAVSAPSIASPAALGAIVGSATYASLSTEQPDYWLEGTAPAATTSDAGTSARAVPVSAAELAGYDLVSALNSVLEARAWSLGLSLGQSAPALKWEVVDGIPLITQQPVAGWAYVGSYDCDPLSVGARLPYEGEEGADGVLTYQWYASASADLSDAAPIEGATEATYQPGLDQASAAYYYCIVTNRWGSADAPSVQTASSAAVPYAVVAGAPQAPVFSVQPEDAQAGGEVTLEAQAATATEGAEVSYQWYESDVCSTDAGTAIEGATSASYRFTPQATEVRYYYVVATTMIDGNATASAASSIAAVLPVAAAADGLTVASAQDLLAIVQDVASGNTYAGQTITIVRDIDASGIECPTWTSSYYFAGTLEGNGHTISNLAVSSTGSYVGLFSRVGYGAVVRNLVFAGSCSFTGGAYVGAVAGYASNSYGATTVALTLENVGNNGTVTATSTSSGHVGGLVGDADSYQLVVENCYNKGAVSAPNLSASGYNGAYLGGIAGRANHASSSFTNCYNTGSLSSNGYYVGGIAGYASSSTLALSHCYSTGAVTYGSTCYPYAYGALVGYGSSSLGETALAGSYYLDGICTPSASVASDTQVAVGGTSATYRGDKGAVKVTAPDGMAALPSVTLEDGTTAAYQTLEGANGGYPALYWEDDAPVQTFADAAVSGLDDQVYSGSEITLEGLAVTLGDATLALYDEATGKGDYTVSYSGNVAVGRGVVTITGKNSYEGGTLVKYFKILPLDLTGRVTVQAVPSQPYTGSAVKPALAITFGESELALGTDYTVTYENYRDAGTATATATFKGSYTGSASVAFNIIDTSSYDQAVKDAQAALEGVAISKDGTDVYPYEAWASMDDAFALMSAVAKANAALDYDYVSQAEVDAATAAVAAAQETFEGAVKAGTKAVDASALEGLISQAGQSLDAAAVSADGTDVYPYQAWATEAQADALNAAVAAAQAVLATEGGATQAQLDVAAAALQEALDAFDAAVEGNGPGTKAVDKAALAKAVQEARAAREGVPVSADGTDIYPYEHYMTQAQSDALAVAIAAAQAVADNDDATAEEVADALAAITGAAEAFSEAVGQQLGTKAVDSSALEELAASAEQAAGSAVVSEDGTDVPPTGQWVAPDVADALADALDAARAIDTGQATQDELNQAVADLQAALDAFNAAKRLGTQADAEWTRLFGADRYQTNAAVVADGFAPEDVDTVIIATGENYPDALAASALAGISGAPILLTGKDELAASAAEQIDRLGPENAYIVGSVDAVSAAVADAIGEKGVSVKRLGGSNRIATALAIYNEGGSNWGSTAIVASGETYADALSISPLAYAERYPIFLASADGTVDVATSAALSTFDRVILVGGTARVADSVGEEAAAAGAEVIRLAGGTGNSYPQDRYGTSAAIAKFSVADSSAIGYDNLLVATGENYPDALGGSVLAGKRGAVLLLTNEGDGLFTANEIVAKNAAEIATGSFLGSESVVSKGVATVFVNAAK